MRNGQTMASPESLGAVFGRRYRARGVDYHKTLGEDSSTFFSLESLEWSLHLLHAYLGDVAPRFLCSCIG